MPPSNLMHDMVFVGQTLGRVCGQSRNSVHARGHIADDIKPGNWKIVGTMTCLLHLLKTQLGLIYDVLI